jgi:hypothetical protein
MLNIEKIIESIKKSGKFGESPVFSKEQIEEFEKALNFSFPEDYKKLITTIDPEIINFYFVEPYRHPHKKNYIIFAEWTEDVFAFDDKNYKIVTILKNDDSGKTWNNFLEWIEYVWFMSSRPVNPE